MQSSGRSPDRIFSCRLSRLADGARHNVHERAPLLPCPFPFPLPVLWGQTFGYLLRSYTRRNPGPLQAYNVPRFRLLGPQLALQIPDCSALEAGNNDFVLCAREQTILPQGPLTCLTIAPGCVPAVCRVTAPLEVEYLSSSCQKQSVTTVNVEAMDLALNRARPAKQTPKETHPNTGSLLNKRKAAG